MEARQDPAVAPRIEQGQGEALVAAGLLERVEADQPDALEGPLLGTLEDGRPRGDLVKLARDREDLVEMRVEDGFEVVTAGATGQTGQPGFDPARPPGDEDDDDEEHDDGDRQTEEERAEVRLDERVEVDPGILRWAGPSLAGPSHRGLVGRDAILCRRQSDPSPASARAGGTTTSLDGGPHQIMAKRARGSTSRPGQRPPLQRQPARPAARPVVMTTPVVRPDTLTDEEEARAAQLEAAIVAEERQAEATTTRRIRPTRTEEATPRSSNLEVSAAEEYAYVARDVRRIAIVGGSLLGILLLLWLIAHLAGIGAS